MKESIGERIFCGIHNFVIIHRYRPTCIIINPNDTVKLLSAIGAVVPVEVIAKSRNLKFAGVDVYRSEDMPEDEFIIA